MFLHLHPRHYFKKDRHFYVCSFGGCGSWVLSSYLKQFGVVHHVHSRNPPPVAVTKVVGEHFTQDPSPALHHVVIYLYRDPVSSLLSVKRRFPLVDHFKNIGAPDPTVSLETLADSRQDLIGLTDFFRNYTTPSSQRKYPIYCVKYELLFDNFHTLNYALGLIDYPKLYPRKKETTTKLPAGCAGLRETYRTLQMEMDRRPFLSVA